MVFVTPEIKSQTQDDMQTQNQNFSYPYLLPRQAPPPPYPSLLTLHANLLKREIKNCGCVKVLRT